MQELGFKNYESYLEFLRRNPDEAEGLADRMRVTVSRFFREWARWVQLAERVLPELLSKETTDKRIRTCSLGCCGGEEPYTLALLWLEYLQPRYADFSMEILGIDIDSASLERARRAVYSGGSLREVPTEIRKRWFRRENNLWHLDDRVVEFVKFEKINFMTDPVPEAFDLILCRYLAFTYYYGKRRHAAARRLWSALRPGGSLMIGRKEGLGSLESEFFEPWPKAEGIFRKKR